MKLLEKINCKINNRRRREMWESSVSRVMLQTVGGRVAAGQEGGHLLEHPDELESSGSSQKDT